MTTVIRNRTPIVIPPAIRRRAGLKAGDRLEFKVSGNVITVLPKTVAPDDEYTSGLRRAIDARLAEARKGPYYGPFDGVADIQAEIERPIWKITAQNE